MANNMVKSTMKGILLNLMAMKRGFLILSLVLLVGSLFGVGRAYTLPTETETEEMVRLLDYQHEGSFDYLVYLKPSHLFGPEPQEPPPPPLPSSDLKYPAEIIDRFNLSFSYSLVPDRPVAGISEEVEVRAIVKSTGVEQELPPLPPPDLKYPTEIIDRFNLTFSYSFVPDRPVAGISEEVEVRAIVKKPDAEEEEIILKPKTSETGDFTVNFPLDMSDNISGSDITITAYVYTTVETDTGMIFEVFTQSLAMRSRGPLVEVEGDLDHTESGYVGELNYEQRGEFNYEVLLKSKSPFGAITLKPPSATPPPPKTLGSGDTKEIILKPRTPKTGDFTVNFPLDMSDNISDITITAYVYTTVETDTGPIFEVFTPSLAMRSRGPLLEVGDLNHTKQGYVGELNYEQQGEFNYEVCLKPDSPFGDITLKPPSFLPPTVAKPLPAKTQGPGDTILSKLVDGVNVSFSYHLESSKPIRQLDEELEVEAIVENPEKWSKTVVLIPPTKKSGDFTITFPLELNQFTEIFDTIQQETRVPASACGLTIKANVHVTAQTDFGMIDEDFTQSIKTNLREGILAWDGDLEESQPRSIETTEVIRNQEKYLGLPVTQTRILFAAVVGIIFILSVFSLLIYVRSRPEKPAEIDRKAERAAKKYKDIIVNVKEMPGVELGEAVVSLDSLDDLVKAAQGFLKPVLHQAESDRHTYCAIDGTTRYQYVIQEEE